jgi:predicted GNAT family acetyltransferase
VDVKHDEAEHRFYIPLEGEEEALLLYRREGSTLEFYHTFVPEESRQKGLAEKIVEAGFDYAKHMGYKVKPTCPYVSNHFLRKRKEFLPFTA